MPSVFITHLKSKAQNSGPQTVTGTRKRAETLIRKGSLSAPDGRLMNPDLLADRLKLASEDRAQPKLTSSPSKMANPVGKC